MGAGGSAEVAYSHLVRGPRKRTPSRHTAAPGSGLLLHATTRRMIPWLLTVRTLGCCGTGCKLRVCCQVLLKVKCVGRTGFRNAWGGHTPQSRAASLPLWATGLEEAERWIVDLGVADLSRGRKTGLVSHVSPLSCRTSASPTGTAGEGRVRWCIRKKGEGREA